MATRRPLEAARLRPCDCAPNRSDDRSNTKQRSRFSSKSDHEKEPEGAPNQ
jgi:hypothetical protein